LPGGPGATRAARAAAQLVLVLRRRHLHTGSIGEWAAPLGSGQAWQSAQRLVAQAGWRNENSVQNLAGLRQVVENWEALNKEFPIGDKRWCVHHVPEVTPDLLTRLKTMGCGVQMAAFRWVTSNDPKVVVGPPFRTIVDHGISAGVPHRQNNRFGAERR